MAEEDISEDMSSEDNDFPVLHTPVWKVWRCEYRYWKRRWNQRKWFRKQGGEEEEKKHETSMFTKFQKLFKKKGGNNAFYILHLLRLNVGC